MKEYHPQYFRDPQFRYPLSSHLPYDFLVGWANSLQVLFTIGSPQKILMVSFNSDGNFIELKGAPRTGYSEQYFSEDVNRHRNEMGLVDAPIRVKRFFIFPELLGVEDLPDDLSQFARDPEAFDVSEHEDLKQTTLEWKQSNQFVFWCGQSFYVDMNGIVTTS